MSRCRTILATYRLQLHGGFTLADAGALVPYLSRLGVSHIHCSPLLRSRRGSTHGYDVVDPTMLDPALGTEADLAALHQALAKQGMGLVLDIVPNHMAASHENPAWEDVLAHGPASRYARWFDIEWRASSPTCTAGCSCRCSASHGRRCSRAARSRSSWTGGVPRLRYFEHGFPLDPSTLPAVLDRRWHGAGSGWAPSTPAAPPWPRRSTGCGGLPRRTARDAGAWRSGAAAPPKRSTA